MRTITELLHDSPFFIGLHDPVVEQLAGCGQTARFAEGQMLFRAGQPADTFYLVRHGRVAVELHNPSRGTITLDTVHDGDVVGWSWLVPPYLWTFDARAVEATSAVEFDGACLRTKCDTDPALGYDLMRRVSQVMYERLQAARVQMLDMYGAPM